MYDNRKLLCTYKPTTGQLNLTQGTRQKLTNKK